AFVTFTALLLWLIPNIVQTPAQLRRVVAALLLSFVAVVAFGLFQFAGDMVGLPTSVTGLRTLYTKDVLGFTRIQSTAYEPLYFANYLLLPLSLLAALFLSGRSTLRAGWLALLFGIGVINLVLTASRGGYLALAGLLAVVGIFSMRRLLSPRNLVLVASIVVVGAMVVFRVLGIGGSAGTNDLFRSHITNVFYGASYQERVETIQTAMQAWREQPVLGLGFGGFGPYAAPHPAYVPKDGWRIVNNEFVELLAENGIIGAFLFGLFILVIITRSVRVITRTRDAYLRAVSVALLAAWVGVLIQYLTFSTLYIVHVWFLLGLTVAVQNMALREVSTAEPQPAVASTE
ncbi:MAG: O-antigen ligase family protein, partial [Patescibacteria group bacterium]